MERLFISTLGPAPALLIPIIAENRLELSAVQAGVCIRERTPWRQRYAGMDLYQGWLFIDIQDLLKGHTEPTRPAWRTLLTCDSEPPGIVWPKCPVSHLWNKSTAGKVPSSFSGWVKKCSQRKGRWGLCGILQNGSASGLM